MTKTVCSIQHTKKNRRIEEETNGEKDGKALLKLMNKAVYGEAMKNVRNKINLKIGSNEKDYLKWTSKPIYMPRKIVDNDLVGIHKRINT